ncbi:hypothetical protein [Streptomyces sp. NPDC058466]|uniref:hypothetical protein n=1 Tax=Streptomyces sp. NPDC058466 TaxID=3346512 RepID=UPI0036536BD1
MPTSPEAKKIQSRIAINTRWHPDSPQIIEDQREYKALTLEDHIKRVVDSFPPLTEEQRARLAVLLRPGMEA